MLSQTCIERLTILADYMEGLDDPRFTMRRVNHPCGTPACAIGHALTLPALVEQGIGKGQVNSNMLHFFDISNDGEFYALFSVNLSRSIHTPQQWAAHCRKWLAEHGAVLPTKPAQISTQEIDGSFERFLERLLDPVEESHDL